MTIRGQQIVLPIQAPNAPGAVKLNISPADRIVTGMSFIHRAMQPKSLTALSGGGVSGYCRASGEPLIQKGADPSVLKLEIVGGKPALAFSNYFGVGSLAFQPGSASKSYTQVIVVNVSDPTDRVNFLFSYTDETPIASVLRYDIRAILLMLKSLSRMAAAITRRMLRLIARRVLGRSWWLIMTT